VTNPEFMLGSISPSFAPGATPQEMSAAIRAEMWKLLGAAANSFAAP